MRFAPKISTIFVIHNRAPVAGCEPRFLAYIFCDIWPSYPSNAGLEVTNEMLPSEITKKI